MPKQYSDRSMSADTKTPSVPLEQDFFFPKANPPVTIRAASLEEAEAKLLEIKQ